MELTQSVISCHGNAFGNDDYIPIFFFKNFGFIIGSFRVNKLVSACLKRQALIFV